MTALAGWPAAIDPSAVLDDLLVKARESRRFDIGFPGATDLVVPALAPWLTEQLLNNIGDPWDAGHGHNHTKDLEQQVVGIIADLFRAPASRWGYVTGGATEGTEHALYDAVAHYPDVVVYTSTAAHYSVTKIARKLKLPLVLIRTYPRGQMNVEDLRSQLALRRDRPAIVVATAGTTMTEAVDDVAAIVGACEDLAITRRRIHVDAALSGVPLALLPVGQRPAFDFAAGATSMVVSGHKFLSTLMPCGVIIHDQPPARNVGPVTYTGSLDSTISGSRSGHTPLILWHNIVRLGADGHRARADQARALAEYTHQQLLKRGIEAHRNPHAMTVTLPSPPSTVLDRWVLADDGTMAHIICMPGVIRDQIDDFLADLDRATQAPRRIFARRSKAAVAR